MAQRERERERDLSVRERERERERERARYRRAPEDTVGLRKIQLTNNCVPACTCRSAVGANTNET